MVVLIEQPVHELLNVKSFKDRSRKNQRVIALFISSISMHCILQDHHLDGHLNVTQLGRFYMLVPYPKQELKTKKKEMPPSTISSSTETTRA